MEKMFLWATGDFWFHCHSPWLGLFSSKTEWWHHTLLLISSICFCLWVPKLMNPTKVMAVIKSLSLILPTVMKAPVTCWTLTQTAKKIWHCYAINYTRLHQHTVLRGKYLHIQWPQHNTMLSVSTAEYNPRQYLTMRQYWHWPHSRWEHPPDWHRCLINQWAVFMQR